jgi:glucosyl-3-phosphoglycerate synthase
MAATRQLRHTDPVERWFERRSFDHARYADLDALGTRKRELGLTATAVLPAREVAATIPAILDTLHALNRQAPLLDQIVVVDARSADGTAEVAAAHGAEVHVEDELLPQLGPVLGKGDAMWRALSVVRGDLVLYLDSDCTDFRPHFVNGLLGPLLSEPGVQFVKGLYSRPWSDGRQVSPDGGARVTELTAKPLLNLHFSELAGFAQPLAGEAAATRQPLFALGKMAFAVLRAVELRRGQDGAAIDAEQYVHAIRSADDLRLERSQVELVERPPLTDLLGPGARG